MTTETITEERITEIYVSPAGNDYVNFARAIEQDILQSPHVQQWKKDADAFRAMVSKRLTVSVRDREIEVFHWDDCLAWPPCDPDADDDTRAEVARSAIAKGAAAMEAKDE